MLAKPRWITAAPLAPSSPLLGNTHSAKGNEIAECLRLNMVCLKSKEGKTVQVKQENQQIVTPTVLLLLNAVFLLAFRI